MRAVWGLMRELLRRNRGSATCREAYQKDLKDEKDLRDKWRQAYQLEAMKRTLAKHG